MRAFYEEHYRPDAMCLAVLGKERLDELQAWMLRTTARLHDCATALLHYCTLHYSRLTAYYSLPSTHYSLLTAYCLLLQAWVLDEFASLPAPSALPSPTAAAAAPGHAAAAAAAATAAAAAAAEPLSPAASLPLSPAQLGSTLSVRPVREARSLRLMWAVPPETHWQPSKAPGLIGALIDHEGERGLHHLLPPEPSPPPAPAPAPSPSP